MRLATWNVNGIRARIDRVLAWLALADPDVVCLQETRVSDAAFPLSPFVAAGYEVAMHGDGGRNGVAILSRVGLTQVQTCVGDAALDAEARLLRATCAGVDVWTVYVPNGQTLDSPQYAFKLDFFTGLRVALGRAATPDAALVCMGDFNVAPQDRDVYDPARYRHSTHTSPPERAAWRDLVAVGLHDLVREWSGDESAFTWFSYRPQMFATGRGLRIDHVLASDAVAARVRAVQVDLAERGRPGPSDHAPVVCDLDDR